MFKKIMTAGFMCLALANSAAGTGTVVIGGVVVVAAVAGGGSSAPTTTN